MLFRRSHDLSKDPDFTDVTHELSFDGPTLIEDFPEDARDSIRGVRDRGGRQIVISGYVDATPKGYNGCAWVFDIAEGEPDGWSLDRHVTLYPHEGDNIETVLPTHTFAGWADVAEAFPRLIAELLATPLPYPHA